jgi:hypothetical protein
VIDTAINRGDSPLTVATLEEVVYGNIPKGKILKIKEVVSDFIMMIYIEAGKAFDENRG